MTQAYTWRKANAGDLSRIVDIYNSTIASRMVTADTQPVTVEQRRDWFEQHQDPRRPLLVAEQQGEVVAWLSFSNFYGRPAYQHTAEISLYIAEECRGQGLGKRLLVDAEQHARDCGIENLLAIIFSHNLPSIALFEKLGYQHWGELPEIARMDGQDYSATFLGKKL